MPTLTSGDCLKKYGEPSLSNAKRYCILWDVPGDINEAIPTIPNKIYCNKDMIGPVEKAFRNLIERKCTHELLTYDGCFNIRKKRGLPTWSLHSWAIAIDVNAAANPLGGKPTLSPEFVQCFTDAGLEWGGTWPRKDGMHFQLAQLPTNKK